MFLINKNILKYRFFFLIYFLQILENMLLSETLPCFYTHILCKLNTIIKTKKSKNIFSIFINNILILNTNVKFRKAEQQNQTVWGNKRSSYSKEIGITIAKSEWKKKTTRTDWHTISIGNHYKIKQNKIKQQNWEG